MHSRAHLLVLVGREAQDPTMPIVGRPAGRAWDCVPTEYAATGHERRRDGTLLPRKVALAHRSLSCAREHVNVHTNALWRN
jgi:hypothetical protein